MRPSISVTLEPGLERGVPWGRDLYTFVTSAAGHMMRTLQKPRKNRPSKRQVNHRRFLHNMIQRKFADIEAANQRLASTCQEEEKNVSSPPSQKPEILDRPGSPSKGGYLQVPDSAHTDVNGISKSGSDVSVGSHETEISEKKQPDSGHLWKRHPKSQPTTCTDRKNKERQKKESQSSFMSSPKGIEYHHGAEVLHTECYDDDSQLINLTEDSQTTQQDSGCIQFNHHVAISPSFSPEISPLSLDSCDFSIQMFTDLSTQKSIADMSESQWTDIMDLFAVGGKDLGGCMDLEAYFESICACQSDAGQEVGADDVGFADQSDSFSNRSEVEDLHCETGEYTYQYSCHGDPGLPFNHFPSDRRRQNEDTAETQFNNFKPTQETDIIQNHHNHHYSASELQTYQHPREESPCMLVNCENNQNFTPFECIAQSFSVHNPEHRPILTLPHEDDWLFADILKDRKSPGCQ